LLSLLNVIFGHSIKSLQRPGDPILSVLSPYGFPIKPFGNDTVLHFSHLLSLLNVIFGHSIKSLQRPGDPIFLVLSPHGFPIKPFGNDTVLHFLLD